VLRLQAWHWLDRVLQISGAGSPSDLDKDLQLAHAPKHHRFQSIADDGFDPGLIKITKTLSLLGHVTSKTSYLDTQHDYAHNLWKALQDRHWKPPDQSGWIERALKNFDIFGVEWRDSSRADQIGLDWPEFRRDEDGRATTPVHSLHAVLKPEQLTSLDGMLLLLLLYRQCIDQANFRLAEELSHTIRVASQAFESRFHEEGVDTWRFVMRTRILAWIPDFQPSELMVKKATALLRERFEAKVVKGRGRARLHPDKAINNKARRRWRRRTLMSASGMDENPYKGSSALVGFQQLNLFTDWLRNNRHAIDARASHAIETIMAEAGAEPPIDGPTVTSLYPLEIPVDGEHRISRPPSDAWYDYTIGDLPFDRIPIVLKDVSK
jgi:hypothetical protein